MTTDNLTVCVADQCYGLQASPAEALSYFRRAYAACLGDPLRATQHYTLSRRGRGWQACSNGERIFASGSLREVTRLLDWELTRRTIRQDSPCAAFHAAWLVRGRQPVMLAGEGGSGKSRLCLQLLEHGFRCGAEDVTFVDGDQLKPFPHAIQLRKDDLVLRTVKPARLFRGCDGRVCVSIGEEDVADQTRADRLLVVFLDHSASAASPRPLAPLDALRRLFHLCHRLDRVTRPVFETFAAAAAAGRMFILPGAETPAALLPALEANHD